MQPPQHHHFQLQHHDIVYYYTTPSFEFPYSFSIVPSAASSTYFSSPPLQLKWAHLRIPGHR
eukprot:scaffold22159_cov75-Skeletonema_marinoi.AAC.1